MFPSSSFFFFFFNDTATTEIYTLSLHDALPISKREGALGLRKLVADLVSFSRRHFLELGLGGGIGDDAIQHRTGEHTSELQSPCNLVCRLLLEKKKNNEL